MNKADFLRWFNRDFWKAFSRSNFPIEIPKTPKDKTALVESVYEDIASARYAPSIPEADLVMNKGYGVARTVPVFGIRDYCVYYFCIKELEDVLCGNRTPNTFVDLPPNGVHFFGLKKGYVQIITSGLSSVLACGQRGAP